MTLTDFLLARIAEDEADARAATPEFGDGAALGDLSEAGHRFYATHDPARVLAECAAKRAIVAAHTLTTNGWEGAIAKAACRTCVEFHADMDCENQTWPCPTMRHLAAVYADHPEYSDVWRP